MRKMGFVASVGFMVCLTIPFKGGKISLAMAQDSERLTPQEAVDAARRNSKTGGSLTVLREIVSDTDMRRVGDQALLQTEANRIELFQDGILVNLLRSGGFLLAEYDPRTTNVVALHLVWLGADGAPKDASYPCDGVVKLADAEKLVKDTTEFTNELYSTPPSKALSLESSFYGGTFPECRQSEGCEWFAVPGSLLKLGSDNNEYREAVALYSAIDLSGFQYALSMPIYAANPIVATRAAAEKWESLKAEFLRKNHMRPEFDFALAKIQSKKQLREQIVVLRKLDKFLEGALRNGANPALVKANISVAGIPLGIVASTENGQVIYQTGTGSPIVIFWKRAPTGGFAVHVISLAG